VSDADRKREKAQDAMAQRWVRQNTNSGGTMTGEDIRKRAAQIAERVEKKRSRG
jgi:hypothetical protein